MSNRYYQGSPPFEWLRKKFGITKPYALAWEEWDVWKRETRAAHPVGYWMTEKLPDYLEKIPEYTIDWYYELKYYWRNRYWRQTHVLPTGLKVGQYYDLDTRILHGLMNSLVDFVEVEKAWMNRWDENGKIRYKMKKGRNAIAGIAHLQWEMGLTINEDWVDKNDPNYGKPTSQAETAMEIMKLYNWWKFERPLRPDPHDTSGWTAYCDACRQAAKENGEDSDLGWVLGGRADKSPKLKKMSAVALDKLHKIEKQYNDEDEAMLIRLIKIRQSLWT